MRNLDFFLAAVFALAAVYTKFAGNPWWVPVLLIVLAGGRLFTGMQKRAREQRLQRNPIVLDDEQLATIRDMKARGQEIAAIKQVRLWYRDADLLTARQLVDAA
ncbi:hypothetical protein [Corynebacterium epidermidicanis]|uniref:Uncharacterized protein n=1 Tax=Corynebacterium epidermidicanis TaxID=1050174 RepID=A0A0G3GRN5_9CORY|nr:hypothetical protein [Corynebacterium epidermidicanis]AKK03784.1 hypothetical protein CEPID_09695 [Corynebacterium epidermidicanis]